MERNLTGVWPTVRWKLSDAQSLHISRSASKSKLKLKVYLQQKIQWLKIFNKLRCVHAYINIILESVHRENQAAGS